MFAIWSGLWGYQWYLCTTCNKIFHKQSDKFKNSCKNIITHKMKTMTAHIFTYKVLDIGQYLYHINKILDPRANC